MKCRHHLLCHGAGCCNARCSAGGDNDGPVRAGFMHSSQREDNQAPPAGFEPAHPAPEAAGSNPEPYGCCQAMLHDPEQSVPCLSYMTLMGFLRHYDSVGMTFLSRRGPAYPTDTVVLLMSLWLLRLFLSNIWRGIEPFPRGLLIDGFT